MKIDRALLEKIAHLARLEFEEKDVDKMLADMSAIVDWVEKLDEVNTDGVEPLTTMSHEMNVKRPDRVTGHLDHQQALSQAPEKNDEYFKVPRVIE